MDKLNNQKIVITGGKGYLGSFLAKALKKEGADVYTISREVSENEKEYQIDICNASELEIAIHSIQPDFVYHLAANIDRKRDFSNYKQIMETNVEGTLNLLQALKNTHCKNLIFTSSSEVYGNNQSPYKEEQSLLPTSPYSLSKVYGEHLIRTFSEIYSKNYTILRVFNFYGKGMSESFFIPQLIQTLKRNEDFSMTKGEQLRDFLFVDDVVQALMLCAKNKKAYNETFNVCSGYGTSLKQLAEEVKSKIKSNGNIIFGAIPYRENEVWEMIGDNTKIKEKLEFSASISLTQGIEICLEKEMNHERIF